MKANALKRKIFNDAVDLLCGAEDITAPENGVQMLPIDSIHAFRSHPFRLYKGEQLDIRDKLKPIERRFPVLKKHLEQADIYLKFKEKKGLKEADQILFTAAKSYLDDVMNGNKTLPTRTWREEYAKLTTEQKTLNGKYLALKDEVKEAKKIRRSVYDILRREEREQQPHKAQEVDR